MRLTWGATGLVVLLCVLGVGLSFGQTPAPGVPVVGLGPYGPAPAVVPIETRAWAHEGFGRLVFDWPWAAAHEVQVEGTRLTVVFEHRLHTDFWQIPRFLAAYVTDITLGPDGRSVVAELTAAYRLRTFVLESADGVSMVVVDFLDDAATPPATETGPTLAQAPSTPEAVPEDAPDSQLSTPALPFAPAVSPHPDPFPEGEGTDPPTVDPLAVATESAGANPPLQGGEEEGADAIAQEANPSPPAGPPPSTGPGQVLQDGEEEEPSPPGRGAAEQRGGSPAASPSPVVSEGEGSSAPLAGQPAASSSEMVLESAGAESSAPLADQPIAASSEMVLESAGANPPRPSGPPPSTGSGQVLQDGEEEEPSLPERRGGEEDLWEEEEEATLQPLTLSPQLPSLPVSVRIPVSQSRLFQMDMSAASVFVANPEIADVQLISSSVLFVVAKAVGRTSVAALDAGGNLIGSWTIAAVLDIQPARAALEGIQALRAVTVRQLSRGVELSGTVAAIGDADLALRLTTTALPEGTPVENRLHVTGKQQVNLEVQIAEVQRNVSEALGFNWEVLPDIGDERHLGMRVGRFFFDAALGAFLPQTLSEGRAASLSGSTGLSAGRVTVRGMIDALASAGLATVLARPNVTAVSGETASFFSGGEFPLPSGFEDGAIIFDYKQYGVLLDFVPTIIDNGRIMLKVRPEVSQRSDTESLRVSGIDIPVINARRAETTVEVGDGESIVIAGLYRDQSEAVEAGLPVAKDIPLLGTLFGTQSARSNTTELIVVVTARLTSGTTMPSTANQDRQQPGRRVRGYHY